MATAITHRDPEALGAKCKSCPVFQEKMKAPCAPEIPPRGIKPRLIIIGEAPGRLEVFRQRPFIGPSGRLLEQMLRGARLKRHEMYVTNAVACRLETDSNDVKLQALSCCAPRLASELSELDATTPIVPLGAWPTRYAVGVGTILKARGFVWTAPTVDEKKLRASQKALDKLRNANRGKPSDKTLVRAAKKQAAHWLLEARVKIAGRTVIPSVHPAFILRGADGWLPVLQTDLRRAARLAAAIEAGRKFSLEDEGAYATAATPEAVTRLVGGLRGAVSVDVETSGIDPLHDRLLLVGVCEVDTLKVVEVFPWHRRLAVALRKALRGRTVVMHNGPQFDQIVLRREGVL